MKNNNLAIVITAYNRAIPLKNLLTSLSSIKCDREIPLIISIDNQGNEEVIKISKDFEWHHGEKKIIIHKEKLGLRGHFIWAGDQSINYENVVFLEDDLCVSPYIVKYAEKLIEFYSSDQLVAGASLYNPHLCEFNGCKFYQVQDGYDVYFFQHPYWGNIWMKDKWIEFKDWLKKYKPNYSILPERINQWNETSFKKIYIQFLAEKGYFMVFPRVSLVTNMGESGIHSKKDYNQFHVPFYLAWQDPKLCNCVESIAKYDVFFEIVPETIKMFNPSLRKYDFTVDLQGLKKNFNTQYVLTTRKVKSSILSFSDSMKPIEGNLLLHSQGVGISLSNKHDIIFNKKYEELKLIRDVLEFNYDLGLKSILRMLFIVFRKRYKL